MKKLIVLLFIVLVGSVIGLKLASFTATVPQLKPLIQQVPTITPTPTIAPPAILIIPKLQVNSKIEAVGLDKSLRMDVPKGIGNTGWYSLGPKPGEVGNAVIDGHFDTPTGAPTVFYYLGTLQQGDSIQIIDQTQKVYSFTVNRVVHYPDNGFPIVQVFGPSTAKNLNLITCSGTWDRVAHNYSERTVVFATLTTR